MTTITDEQLYAHATRAKDRVVIITGGMLQYAMGFEDVLNIHTDLQVEATALAVRQLCFMESMGEY